jgi:hypothetical protein
MDDGQRHYSDAEARQGDIILRKPWERTVFVFGLAAAVTLGTVAFLALA